MVELFLSEQSVWAEMFLYSVDSETLSVWLN
jgi:hypothetical protein